MEGRDAHQRRDLLPRARPPFREFQQQRPGTHGPNARGPLQEGVVVSPQRTGPEHRLEVVVQRSQACVAPGDMLRNVRCQARARPRQAVLLRGPYAHQWLAAPKKGAQLLRLGIRQRPRCRAPHVGTVGQGPRIQRIRLRQLARRPGNIPDLARVHDDHGEVRRGQGACHQALQAARGFQHNARGVAGLQLIHTGRHSTGLVGDGPALPGGA